MLWLQKKIVVRITTLVEGNFREEPASAAQRREEDSRYIYKNGLRRR